MMLTCVNAIPMNRRLVVALRGPNSRFTKFRPDLLSLTWRKVDDDDRKTKIGDGKIFISAVDEAVRIRTEETGDKAVESQALRHKAVLRRRGAMLRRLFFKRDAAAGRPWVLKPA